MVCPHCGANNVEGEVNCSYCKSSLTGQDSPVVTENETVTNNSPIIEEKPKKNNKGLIILVLGLIVIGVAVFVLFNKDKKNDTPTDTNPSNTNTPVVGGDFTIAVLGQENHGKTALTSAITKKYGDFKDEKTLEKAQEINVNGVKYNASIVEYQTENRTYTLYDFPTNEDIKTALTPGNIEINGAILVVDATNGPMTQTREHIELLEKMGVERLVVFMNNCDKVSDPELLKLVETEIRDLISEYHFDKNYIPVIMGSASLALGGDAIWEERIDELVKALDSMIISAYVVPDIEISE